ncbi:hypothetical protein OKA05_12555 [Luteolibacter arcticus]|uniref:Uncharacterized protein n=1 Tax=Luteolibacter arcticus TaxID=1581411 RepID=A0ABT3GIN5_9BACT|nr:hypothetical protein [Luteolibacter arcticus]MCW1923388.1 hypothetical protein [Luteolibacter arcticus]
MSLIRTRAGLRLLAAASLGLSAMEVHATGTAPDLDGDGVPNLVDPDIDGDGIPNALDENIDGGIAKTGPYAGQYIGDHVNNDNPAERDIDDDGLADDSLGETDVDGDGKSDSSPYEADTDGDGRNDTLASERDMDGDGKLDDDSSEDDIDGDSLDDDDFAEDDIDGDNSSDSMDDDIDGDSRGNAVTNDDDVDGDGKLNDSDNEDDDDGDGARDRDDDDDNNDGIKDHDDDGHHDEEDEIEQRADLAASVQAPAGSWVKVELQSMATGKVELKIRGRDLPVGNYQILIGGAVRGLLTMQQDDDETRGKTEFETGNDLDEDELPLNFAVAGAPISIVREGITFFSGAIPAPPPPPTGGADDDHHNHTYISPLVRGAGAPPEAKGEAEIDVGVAGVIVFEVEAEDLPVGAYDVRVDGALRGTLDVIQLPEKTRGELRFETEPEGDDLELDFPVIGLPVTIRQGETLFFSGTIPRGG